MAPRNQFYTLLQKQYITQYLLVSILLLPILHLSAKPLPKTALIVECGLQGSDDDRIQDCEFKLGIDTTHICKINTIARQEIAVNCNLINDFKDSGFSFYSQKMITRKWSAQYKTYSHEWKTIESFKPKNECVSYDKDFSYWASQRPRFQETTCGLSGNLTDRLEDCKSHVGQASFCFVGDSFCSKKIPCQHREIFEKRSLPVSEWKILSSQANQNTLLNARTNEIWPPLIPRVKGVFKAMDTCEKFDSVYSMEGQLVSFSVPTCGQLAKTLLEGLNFLIPLENLKFYEHLQTGAYWCDLPEMPSFRSSINPRQGGDADIFDNYGLLCVGTIK